MKIKMLEHFQGSGQPSLQFDKEYSSQEIGQALTDWLIEHGKAVDVTPKQKPKSVSKPQPQTQAKKPAPRARKTTRGRAKKNEGD